MSLIFDIFNNGSRSIKKKNQRFTSSGCKDKKIEKLEWAVHFLCIYCNIVACFFPYAYLIQNKVYALKTSMFMQLIHSITFMKLLWTLSLIVIKGRKHGGGGHGVSAPTKTCKGGGVVALYVIALYNKVKLVPGFSPKMFEYF